MMRQLRTLFLTVTLLFATAAASHAQAETVLEGAGATFPYPLYSKWFRDYREVDASVAFRYRAIGSGGGIKRIMERSVDFGASDKFLTDQELRKAPGRLLHIPTVMGAVAVSYNIPGTGPGLKLTPEVLAGIYLGTITRWNDAALASTNPDLTLPDQPIVVFYRSDRSGTSSIFTDYLSSANGEWAQKIGRGTMVAWPVGVGANGSGNVVQKIQETPYSIGYVELAYVLENSLTAAHVKNREGEFVKPTTVSTSEAAVNAVKKVKGDYRISLVNQPGKGVYPIVGLTWLLVYQQQTDAVKGKKLVEFLTWELKHAEKMTSTLHYTPLPKKFVRMVEKTIKSIRY